ncbi:hypothetical protein N7466_006829 [Penicillium verhagenii]|uniref:uncharacterized protein n=1 Tax=Penicillium verhagenii TaxID=1562060 RepID=UPI002544ED5A|nr:uncharacterized protein N7466_006829 [Penicillium verhagenii]KAJ5927873.1 hypothetical protein N7466_006829 [Penicillium verhagenii]
MEGDLVLLRKVVLDQIHGRKLETRWAGPYRVQRVLPRGKSVFLEDLVTGLRVGKYHLDHLKPFVSRNQQQAYQDAAETANKNKAQRRFIKEAIKQAKEDGLAEKQIEKEEMTGNIIVITIVKAIVIIVVFISTSEIQFSQPSCVRRDVYILEVQVGRTVLTSQSIRKEY